MSQTTPTTPVEKELTAEEFDKAYADSYERRRRQAMRSGPVYNNPESAPLVWHDQVFAREMTPSGIVNAPAPLRVGSTQNALDVALIGSHANTGPVSAASGATVTLICLQADEENGEYKAVGPSICVTAPEEGISAEKDQLFCRLPIGNFSKPWLKIRLEFSGTISGGLLDAALSYVAR